MKRSVLAFAAFAVLAGPAAQAQVSREVTDHRIVVNGMATVRVPPDSMRIELRLFPKRGSTDLDQAGLQIAQTMRANGLPDARWTLPVGGMLTENSQGAVMATIRKPTREGVESVARRVAQALPDSLGAGLQSFNISTQLSLDDCSAAIAQAEDAAVAEARRRATHLAALAKLELGGIVGVAEGQSFSPGCTADSNQRFAPDSIYGPLTVPITASITVSFATR